MARRTRYTPGVAHHRRNYCRDCGACRDDVPISRAGRCPDCADKAWRTSTEQVAARSGEGYERWRDGWLRAGGQNGRRITPHAPDA